MFHRVADSGGTVEENVSLAPFTTFHIGGPARYFVRAKTVEQVVAAVADAKEQDLPLFWLGGGSDVLIHDNGFAGLVVKMELNEVAFTDQQVTVGAGMLLSALIMRCAKEGLSGLEFAAGVPATVGGAVWANLGCRGSDVSEVLHSVQVLQPDSTVTTMTAEECRLVYRHSIFKDQPELVILQATFNVQPADAKELRLKIIELTKQKKEEQNVGEYTAGCAFRNNPESDKPASMLIDQAGLKGFTIGGAMVSDKHANFIVNTGEATADDVVQLISYIKQQVRDTYGVQLMEEVEYIGFQ